MGTRQGDQGQGAKALRSYSSQGMILRWADALKELLLVFLEWIDEQRTTIATYVLCQSTGPSVKLHFFFLCLCPENERNIRDGQKKVSWRATTTLIGYIFSTRCLGAYGVSVWTDALHAVAKS